MLVRFNQFKTNRPSSGTVLDSNQLFTPTVYTNSTQSLQLSIPFYHSLSILSSILWQKIASPISLDSTSYFANLSKYSFGHHISTSHSTTPRSARQPFYRLLIFQIFEVVYPHHQVKWAILTRTRWNKIVKMILYNCKLNTKQFTRGGLATARKKFCKP